MSSIDLSSQHSGCFLSDIPILGELSGMWTITGGEVVISSRVSAATVQHFASWRSDEFASLSNHGVDCLMICSSDGQPAQTQVTLVTQDDGSEANRQLASYRFGPSRQYKFHPSVPYTDELVDAMRSHWELVAGALSSDSTLLWQIRRSFEITELIKEVGDSFFAKATKPFRPGRTTRAETFREKVMSTVKDMQQELREPFRNQAGKISFEAIKYLALALHESQCLGRQEQQHPDFDVEGLIKSILIYLCICFEILDPLEKAKFRFYYYSIWGLKRNCSILNP